MVCSRLNLILTLKKKHELELHIQAVVAKDLISDELCVLAWGASKIFSFSSEDSGQEEICLLGDGAGHFHLLLVSCQW